MAEEPPIDPSDPFGDKAFLAEQRRKRGRKAIAEADEFRDPMLPRSLPEDREAAAPPEEDAAGETAEGEPKKAKPRYYKVPRVLRIGPDDEPIWTFNTYPDEAPVIPLGHQGKTYWYLNPTGELIDMEMGKFGLQHIKGLFGKHQLFLWRNWPSFNKQKSWIGFKAELAADALIVAASEKGIFDARQKVRGLGCWKADDGSLIIHLGDRVLVGGEEKKPGEIGAYVYPGRPALLAPKQGGRLECQVLYDDVQTWRWARGELDARLFLGWLACSILGPALDWRPHVFWLGDAGTGKSTLQERLKGILPGWMVSTIDASPAALRQIINQDGVGVAFDEIEADMLNDQAQQVMKLARTAASGGTVYRGGSDHKAAEFMLRGCFGFSAILPPSMRAQDMQRFAFLRLNQLDGKAKMREFTPAQLRDIGAGVVGRAIGGWHRWKPTLEAYVEGLQKVGHAHRGAMQFGSLLAAADLLLHDELPDSDTVDMWCAPLQRDGLYEYEQSEPTWLSAFRRVLTAQPEVWRNNGFPTVGEVILKFWRAHTKNQEGEKAHVYQNWLTRAGMAIVLDQRKRPWLAIPPRGQVIQQIFAGSDMQARGGEGVWTNALRGAPPFRHGDGVWKADNVRALNRAKCTLYRLDAVVDLAGKRTPIFDLDEDDLAGPQAIEASYEREPGEDG